MNSFRNRVVFSVLSIAGTAGLVSLSNPAAAAPVDAPRQAAVFTADLDLGRPAGQATFERRVAAAVRSVCAEPGSRLSAAEASCRRDATTQARHDAGIVDVAAD